MPMYNLNIGLSLKPCMAFPRCVWMDSAAIQAGLPLLPVSMVIWSLPNHRLIPKSVKRMWPTLSTRIFPSFKSISRTLLSFIFIYWALSFKILNQLKSLRKDQWRKKRGFLAQNADSWQYVFTSSSLVDVEVLLLFPHFGSCNINN